MATTNLGRIGFVLKGDWVAGTYKRLDVVYYLSASWSCQAATTTGVPGTSADWVKMIDAPSTAINDSVTATNTTWSSQKITTDRQATLVSGTNIKTVGGTSLLGSGDVVVGDVTLNGVQTLTNKTLTTPVITNATGSVSGITLNDGYTEEIFALSGTTPALNPANGSIQTWTLEGASTPTDSLNDGQSLILGITAGAHSITWPSVTWAKVGGSGAAPTLTSSGVNWVVLWKVGGVLRGSFLGTA